MAARRRRSKVERTRQAFRGVIDFVDVEVTEFQAALVDIANDFEKRILALLAEMTVEDGTFVGDKRSLAKLSKLQRDIDAALLETGYTRRAQRLLDRVPELRRQIRGAWAEATGSRIPFTTADLEAIRLAVGAQFQAYANIGDQGAAAIAELLTQSVAGQETWESAVSGLRQVLIGTGRRDKRGQGMFRHAHTLADTAMAQLQRTMDRQLAASAEIETFVYMGPVDAVARPFCRRMMQQARDGKVWTLAEIAKLDNSRDAGGAGAGPGSAFTQGGGWNCRHIFRPFVPED